MLVEDGTGVVDLLLLELDIDSSFASCSTCFFTFLARAHLPLGVYSFLGEAKHFPSRICSCCLMSPPRKCLLQYLEKDLTSLSFSLRRPTHWHWTTGSVAKLRKCTLPPIDNILFEQFMSGTLLFYCTVEFRKYDKF